MNYKKLAKSILSKIIKVLYPDRCAICTDILEYSSRDYLCKRCRNNVGFITGTTCYKCGCRVDVGDILCEDCYGKSTAFERGHSIFEYKRVRKSIAHFKYRKIKSDAVNLAKVMKEYIDKHFVEFYDFDIITAVPIHTKKFKQRGFNQSDELAKELGKLTGVYVNCNILKRVRNTKAQNRLKPAERTVNVKGAFEFNPDTEIDDKTVLIIDDIYTTGSTINECSKELLKNGAKRVEFLALSIAGTTPKKKKN